MMRQVRRTVVAFNAHPDDEALLSGGTLAGLASRGHRVVLVTATDGGLGLADAELMRSGALGAQRLQELQTSAAALGASEVIPLGYADSGHRGEVWPDPQGQVRFVRAPLEEVAERVGQIVQDESAHLLLGYDRNGGYHHRDHVHLHHVAREVARRTGVRLLEATAPRETILRALRLASLMTTLPNDFEVSEWAAAFSPKAEITHRIDVRPYLRAKRTAMEAHVSQTEGVSSRTLGAILSLPSPLYRLAFGTEHFVEPDGRRGRRPLRDVLEAADA